MKTGNQHRYIFVDQQNIRPGILYSLFVPFGFLGHLADPIFDAVEIDKFGEKVGTIYEFKGTETVSVTKDSTADKLQPFVAKWYVALRTFALVGLLSVIVYIGIRIILSSNSAQNQAKYKNMLKDWIVAICILFILHYTMAFVLNITKSITKIFTISAISPGGEDIFMTNIRNKVGSESDYWVYFGYIVIYIALVILTITYTIEYLKRTFFVAFLVMIAPLIALTYPLDKIKDGQAQAFSIWMKEFTFNCLIQPLHLLLYTILVGSATEIIYVNPVYAVVAMACFKPAEKLLRKIFGFDKASSINTLGAAAGGAMIMNALNKIKAKPSKGGTEGTSGGSSGGKSVRTATGNNIGTTDASGIGNSSASGLNILGGSGNSASTGATGTSTLTGNTSRANGFSFSKGLKSLGKNIVGPDKLKSYGKKFTKAAGGVSGALLGGMVSLAANVADGDLVENTGKALGEIGATAGAGYAVGSTVSGNAIAGGENIIEAFKKGGYGEERYNNMKFDKEFYRSSGYKQIEQDSAILKMCGGDKNMVKAATQQFLNNGITDSAKIRKAMQKGVTGDELKEYSKFGIEAPEEILAARKWGSPKTYADLKKIAKLAKGRSKAEFIESIKDIRIGGKNIGLDQAEEVYKNIVDLL